MDFFEAQERSRRTSRWLVLWYLVAVLAAIASYCVAAALIYAFVAAFTGSGAFVATLTGIPARFYLVVAGVVSFYILAVSAYRIWQLSDGGPTIAYLLGARYADPDKCTPSERRLLNVVEEMAIASGITVPPVYVLRGDEAINALVAGYSPNEAVIIVTQGAVTKLSRDELQGVMGHEFSHILNGDMALNVRLVALLSGLTWVAEEGEAWVYRVAMRAKDVPREERSPEALGALFAAAVAFIGFPATFAADAIKAAISRQREFLADAASVQFTRNPDGIAGALDSISALRAHTAVSAAHAGSLSHMFFAPAAPRSWSFPTHPPIAERIRRAHPRFKRDEYRAVRHGERREVAVIDGAGNVVRHQRFDAAAAVASIGKPEAAHVDYAARLLGSMPGRLRQALHDPAQAEAAMLALVAPRPGAPDAPLTADLRAYVGGLARQHQMTLAELAVPAIKEQPQKARDRFLAELAAHVEADGRVTLQEFVLLVYLRQRLREGAGKPIPTRFRRVEEVADDAHVVVSLLAAGGERAAFDQAAAVRKLGWSAPLAVGTLGTARVGEALERLRHLAPFAKPAVLKACVEAAAADGVFRLAEVELLRMVTATLDCPIPPLVAALDPRSLL